MNEKILQFFLQQTCATVCSCNENNEPYCFSCFYAFDKEEGLLYYKSSVNTQHTGNILKSPAVAGTILPDKLNALQVKGIQFEGMVLQQDHPNTKPASSHFYKKYPLAVAMPGDIWTIQLNHIKLTDNSLGFGKKITWSRSEQVVASL